MSFDIPVTSTFSPHTWRCFLNAVIARAKCSVFSTHVEVFLTPVQSYGTVEGFLHTRGGVSTTLQTNIDACKVFSTHVEVFLPLSVFLLLEYRFLHTRGGVSKTL